MCLSLFGQQTNLYNKLNVWKFTSTQSCDVKLWQVVEYIILERPNNPYAMAHATKWHVI